jgi:small subunit ribosomal protein S2
LVGIRNMKRLPELLFIIDVSRETTAVHEANLKEIPIVALVDTNCDPSGVDYIVPANDDAIRAIKLLVGKVADAVIEGKAMRKEEPVDDAGLLADEAARAADLSRGHIELEVELDDEDLLGTSTLAKLAAVKPVVADIVAAEIAPEEIEKPVEKIKATRKKKTEEKPVLDKSKEKKEEDKE